MSTSVDEARLLRRINALRRLQIETAEIDGKFSLQVLKLEAKYDYKLEPILERRRQIIMGEYDPGEDESDTALTYVDVPVREDLDESYMENLKGIPGFWFTVLNNIPIFWSMIQRHDCDPLTYLTNISSVKITQPEPGFTLQFHFAPNQYFTNEILTKQYKLEFGKKRNDPFNIYGPEMIDCIGCDINWKSQDLTVTIKKNKIIKRASFFNFFDPPTSTGDPKLEPYVLNYLLMDFQLAYYLKERVIPKAVLYYLGEAVLRENFGFEQDITQQEDIDITEDWPTAYDRKSILTRQNYEKDMNVWEKSEKALAERLTKQKFEKAEDFEESKVNLSNLLLGEVDKEDKAKFVKSKRTDKELEDMLLGRNNPCEKEIVEVLSNVKKEKPITKKSPKINDKKKIPPDTKNTSSTVKKKRNITKRVKETSDRSTDETETEQFVDVQKELLSYYKRRANRTGKSSKTKHKMEPDTQEIDSNFEESEQFVDLQKDLLSFYNEKAKKEAPKTKQKTEPKAQSVTRRVDASEPSLGLETLLDAYYKERVKNKPNKKDKVKQSQR